MAIKSFRHKGLKKFYETGTAAGIQPKHAKKLRLQLTALGQATRPEDMGVTAWNLHRLHGDLKDQWSISVNGNWRLVFMFDGQDAILVDYTDYH